MPVGPNAHKVPPPWLIAMQRYGPPPTYPNLNSNLISIFAINSAFSAKIVVDEISKNGVKTIEEDGPFGNDFDGENWSDGGSIYQSGPITGFIFQYGTGIDQMLTRY